MCRGPRKSSPPPSSPSIMAGATIKPPPLSSPESESNLLLELAANNDLSTFKHAVENGGAASVDLSAPWYSRSVGPTASPTRRMAYAPRTPAMIAALYGSADVLSFILTHPSVNVNRRCDADGVTALHCAAAGGSPASLDVVKLLINASADIDVVDAAENRPGDVIAKQFSASLAKDLEILLKAPCPRVSSPSKKEYPPDLTLPDIKNGIYGTDEFRMYTFKVKPCSRAYSHDWTECPFVHPGENARRRDPRKFSYSCVPCPDFRKGSCLKSDLCEYAHGVFECWLHPAQYRTRLCKDEIGCSRRVCFFAHKVEELRTVNPTAASVAGHVLSSPRSSAIGGVSSLEMMAALMMPMSPSSSSSPATSWMSSPPALQLPSSRLKASLSARDLDFDLESMGVEGYQQKLLNSLNPASDYSDMFGSIDSSMMSQLQGLAMKNASGYGNNIPSSPTASSSFGLDHSMAKAIMNSRQTAFAKRSQSFIDRAAVPRHVPPLSSPPLTSPSPSSLIAKSDWGSPDGKLDWGVQGDELNKLRKSATFNYRGNGSNQFGGTILPAKSLSADEPDLSWVQHLVKEAPATGLAPVSRIGPEKPKMYQRNGGGGGGGDLLSWDQLYSEQERMQVVA